MSNYDSFLEDFSANSPFDTFYKHGINPEDIKPAIIETFSPYFTDKKRLEEYSIIHLLSGWVNFMLFSRDRWFLYRFEKCLQLFNEAKATDKDSVFRVIVDWLPELNDSLTKFWSFKNLERDHDELEIEEFLEDSLSLIGQVLEGVTKTYLKLVLNINRIRTSTKFSFSEINKLDLGPIVNELIEKTEFPELFRPPPWNIRLNQWRNIAYHHNARIEKDTFLCWYGKEPNVKTITLNRTGLTQVTKSMLNIFNTFRNVETVFLFDNLVDFQEECGKRKVRDFLIREEVRLIELFTEINSQGFKIIDFHKDNNSAFMVLEDMTEGNSKMRAAHSSMFLYHLWLHTRTSSLSIEYRAKNGKPTLRSKVDDAICKEIASGKQDIEYLAEKAEFTFLSK